MLKNYLTFAVRNFTKHTSHSVINVIGLAVGIACCLGILIYVQEERSFDQFHADADRLYRLSKVVTPQEGGEERHAITSGLMGPTLVEDYPEAEAAVRVLPWFSPQLTTVGETSLMVDDILIADANFFEVFDFDLLRGDASRVLEEPLSVVLTESTARQLFGDEDPMDQAVESLNGLTYTVTGIAADSPQNSHLYYDMLISWATTVPGEGPMNASWLNNWLTQVNFTYLLLKEGADANRLAAKLPAFMNRHFPERSDQYHLYLQPLSDIHLGSAGMQFLRGTRSGNQSYVRMFSIIAVVVLLIACFNFMNLSTARAAERTREVGVRKALGAGRAQIVRQYLGEVGVFVVVAVLLALAVVQIGMPALNAITGKSLELSSIGMGRLALMLSGLILACTAIAGTYPAFILSALRPQGALRAAAASRIAGGPLRRVLVTVQFAATIALIAGTVIVYRQVQFSQDKDAGFDREQLLTLRTADTELAGQVGVFKEQLLGMAGVTEATITSQIPGAGLQSFTILPEGKPAEESWTSNVIRLADDDMTETYGLTMVAGRYFDEDRPTDAQEGVVINETLARQLGWENPVGKALAVSGEIADSYVIGVVEDFHFESVHSAIGPLVMFMASRPNYITVRFSAQDVERLLADIKAAWAQIDPVQPFQYTFLDQHWASLYLSERRLMQALTIFAILAIIVAALGLFGLSMHTTARRTKEIGIRKVLGASVSGIVGLLSREFAALVALGAVLAVPATWTLAHRWLSSFAYRIEVGIGVFLLAGVAALAIAIMSVGWQAVRAATADPVCSLRYE